MASSNLSRPIAIPATGLQLGSPFLRSYPVELELFDIPREQFLEFLDGLNRAIVVSPASAAVNGVGSIIGLVPEPTAQTAGMAIELASQVASEVISKGRSGYLIWQANKELFGPRGLKAEVAKLDALARLANIPILNEDGKLNKSSALLAPLSDMESSVLSVQERRIQLLRPWIGELHLVPWEKTDAPQSFMSKIHASTSERQRKSEEKKFEKKKVEALNKEQKKIEELEVEYEKKMSKLGEEEETLRSKELGKGRKAVDPNVELEHDGWHASNEVDNNDVKGKKERKNIKKQEKMKEKELREIEREVKKQAKTKGKESREIEKETKKQEEELVKLEQKRSKMISKYETETEKVRDDRIRKDREKKAIRGIIWLLIRQA